MSSPITNLAAILPSPKTPFTIQNRTIPTPGPNELLVRNRATAINPIDHKIQTYDFLIQNYPHVLGSDVAGEVVSIGSAVKTFVPGDRVVGFSPGIYSGNPDHGAFQEYVLLREIFSTKIPESLSFAEASVFPMAFATAGIAFWGELGIPRTGFGIDDKKKKKADLIWGGSSSVGVTAIQVARDLGLTVYTAAREKHHAWLKSLGADRVFDHRNPEITSKITTAVTQDGVSLDFFLDSISLPETFSAIAKILESLEPASSKRKIATVLPWSDEVKKPDNVEIKDVLAFSHGTGNLDLGTWMFTEYLTKKLADGTLKVAPSVKVIGKSVEDFQSAVDALKAGVSATKLVVELSD